MFTTQYIWREPDPPPNPLLDSFSRLYVTIVSASFLKDSDLIGKQDPFVNFHYGDKKPETDVMDNAGLFAKFDQKFCLTNIEKEVKASKRAVFEAYDKDPLSSDLLGKTKPVSFVCFIQDTKINKHEMVLYDEFNKRAGDIVITTQFELIEAEPEPLKDINLNCSLKINVKEATFLKDFDTFGK